MGAQRTAAWAKYLHDYGYYPIIITRQWIEGQTDLVDPVKNNTLEVEKNQAHEVYQLTLQVFIKRSFGKLSGIKGVLKSIDFKRAGAFELFH